MRVLRAAELSEAAQLYLAPGGSYSLAEVNPPPRLLPNILAAGQVDRLTESDVKWLLDNHPSYDYLILQQTKLPTVSALAMYKRGLLSKAEVLRMCDEKLPMDLCIEWICQSDTMLEEIEIMMGWYNNNGHMYRSHIENMLNHAPVAALPTIWMNICDENRRFPNSGDLRNEAIAAFAKVRCKFLDSANSIRKFTTGVVNLFARGLKNSEQAWIFLSNLPQEPDATTFTTCTQIFHEEGRVDLLRRCFTHLGYSSAALVHRWHQLDPEGFIKSTKASTKEISMAATRNDAVGWAAMTNPEMSREEIMGLWNARSAQLEVRKALVQNPSTPLIVLREAWSKYEDVREDIALLVNPNILLG